VPDQIATLTLPPGVTRENLPTTWGAKADTLAPEEVLGVLHRSLQMFQPQGVPLTDEMQEYLRYIARVEARLAHLPAK